MGKVTRVILGVIGAVVGGIITKGPQGALLGWSIGYGVGAVIDPMTPDMPTPGEPMGELEIMTSKEGLAFPDVLGTTKVTGNLLWYGGNDRRENLEEADTGGGVSGGGDTEYTAGYYYYLTWAMGICLGPVDTLYTIYREEDCVFKGEIHRPATGGVVTIPLYRKSRDDYSEGFTYGYAPTEYQIEDQGYFGLCTFYFGTSDQEIDARMAYVMKSEKTISSNDELMPYRNQCYAVFHGNYIGEYNRCPTMKFVIRKVPECSFDTVPQSSTTTTT